MMEAQMLLLLLYSSLLFIVSLQTSVAKPYCAPSSCGAITNITYPFRLNTDPNYCGDRRAELVCKNNATFLYLSSHKYYVKGIDYSDLEPTIRVVDASINNHTCSFPTTSAYTYDFITTSERSVYRNYPQLPINLMSCPHPLKNSSLYTDATHCHTSNSRFTYIKVGNMNASYVKHMCRVDVIVLTSWVFEDLNNISLEEIHRSLLYGFDIIYCAECKTPLTLLGQLWDRVKRLIFGGRVLLLIPLSIVVFLSAGISFPLMLIIGFTGGLILLFAQLHWFYGIGGLVSIDWNFRESQSRIFFIHNYGTLSGVISVITVIVPRFIICPLVVWLLIYKFRRRHLSAYEAIEIYLQSDNKLMPIRYSYSDLKKITRGFREKLGEGGFGSVYKGKLQSGHHVAVKLLRKTKENSQDFMNEIATIGRIHHVNTVNLIGYCAERSKRALIFDFMPNGSLNRYIFNREEINCLDWDTKFKIAIGVARGIEYLHSGCNIQILHFDIKPHNILLDDKFVAKISDFGLAKLCSVDRDSVTLTTVRGTIGYVAPELINRSFGRVSYKADVYSFGMLLMEMVGMNQNLRGKNNDSTKYFPYWIYEHINQGRDIGIGKAEENINGDDENESVRRFVRKMTIVALWCIQTSPDARPSMNKVLEMLESEVEYLEIPAYLSQSQHMVVKEDETCSTDDSIPWFHSNNAMDREIEIKD